MKRFLAILLVLSLLLVPMAAFAEDEGEAPKAPITTKIPKTLEVINEAVNPELEFTFEFTNGEVIDGTAEAAPDIDPVTVKFGEGSTDISNNDIVLNEAAFKTLGVGRYKYDLQEKASDVLGAVTDERTGEFWVYVTYNAELEDLEVTSYLVLYGENEEKGDSFKNEFRAGSLEVTKTVAGNMGDKTQDFEITITFTKPAEKKVDASVIKVNGEFLGEGVGFDENNTLTINATIKHKEKIVIDNLPYGLTYVVTEKEYDGYDTVIKYEDEENKVIDSKLDKVEVINTKETDVPTGITLDNMPYIILMAVALVGLGAFALRKRAQN